MVFLDAFSPDGKIYLWQPENGLYHQRFALDNTCELHIQGCRFTNLHPENDLNPEDRSLLRQYGGILGEEDERSWKEVTEKMKLSGNGDESKEVSE